MPDAADRIRVEPKASRRQSVAPKTWARRLMPKSKRTVAGAALAAMMIGIVVNAIALQHGRRIDLGPDLAATSAVRATTPAPSTEKTAQSPAVQAKLEVAPPSHMRAEAPAVASEHPAKNDEIADFLRARDPDKRRLTLSAQKALAKLGFAVKATGALDSQTRSALSEYAKSRHLTAPNELTAKFVKTLVAAAVN